MSGAENSTFISDTSSPILYTLSARSICSPFSSAVVIDVIAAFDIAPVSVTFKLSIEIPCPLPLGITNANPVVSFLYILDLPDSYQLYLSHCVDDVFVSPSQVTDNFNVICSSLAGANSSLICCHLFVLYSMLASVKLLEFCAVNDAPVAVAKPTVFVEPYIFVNIPFCSIACLACVPAVPFSPLNAVLADDVLSTLLSI